MVGMSWSRTEPPWGLRITTQMKASTPVSAVRSASGSDTEPSTYSTPSWRGGRRSSTRSSWRCCRYGVMKEPTWPAPPSIKTFIVPLSHRVGDRAVVAEEQPVRVHPVAPDLSQLRLVQPDAQTRAFGHRDVAARALERTRERDGLLLIDLRVLLDREVRDRGVEVDGGSGQDRPEEVVRHQPGMERLGDGRDLLDVRDAAGQPEVRPDVLGAAGHQQLAELPDRVHPLAVGQCAVDPLRDLGLRLDRVDLDRVLDQQRSKLFEGVTERDRLEWRQFPVELQDDVHVAPDGLAGGCYLIDRPADQRRQRHVLEAGWDRVPLDRREPL